jgi:hypothetical protein
LASLMILPQIFLSPCFLPPYLYFQNFTFFKTLSRHLSLRLPFFRQPLGCEKVIFLQGEFSSILTKCSTHLKMAAFITLYK